MSRLSRLARRPLVAGLLGLSGFVAVGGTATLARTWVAPVHAPSEMWIAVRPIRTEDEIQRLCREVDLRGRYDDFTLAVGNAATLAWLQTVHPQSVALGPTLPGEKLYVVTLLPGEQVAPRGGLRLLEQDVRHAIVGVAAGVEIDPHDLLPHRTHALFHDGVAPVPADRQSPARTSRPAGSTFAAPPVPDPRVQALVNAVVQANLDADVNTLSNTFHTRRSDQPDGTAAQNYLKTRFEALGLATTLFNFDSGADNVIADLPGLLEPEKVVIVGAHYDSINYNGSGARAPGADDNASGSAAVLELARIFSQTQTRFRYTVRFCLFAAEEFGLVGSDTYSANLVSSGVEVVAMLNTDMNAYKANGDARDLDMCTTDTTTWLTNELIALSQLYVPGLPVVQGGLGGGTSDHRSFYLDGYPAAFYFEDLGSYSPYIHGPNDTYGTSANDFTLAWQIVQSVAAGLASMAEPADLLVNHVPLADSEDSWNPYLVRATVTSVIGTTPASGELHYDAGAGEVVVALRRTGAPDEWIGQVPPQPSGQSVLYFLVATDDGGNSERHPLRGELSFQVGLRDIFFADDFEAGQGGWTHGGQEDDFEIGTPAGKSTDPTAAFSGTKCFGNDLGAAGFNGEYRPSADSWLKSPALNASGRSNVRMRYARWLGVEDGVYDLAELRVAGSVYWTNPVGGGSDHLVDDGWVLHDLDVSATAANNPDFTLRFKMTSDGGLQFGGWNVDDVELYTLLPGQADELTRDSALVSLADGGTVNLNLDLGAAFAGRDYIVLASVSGTTPGFTLQGTHIPLNYDAVTTFFLQFAPVLPGFMGTADGSGRATATLTVPPGQDPGALGARLWFAGVTLGPNDHATNAVELLFTE